MGVDRETGFGKTVMAVLRLFFLTHEQGAETTIYLAISPDAEGVSSEYFFKKKPAKEAKRALNPELAKQLWALSEQITKVVRDGNAG